MQDAKKRSLSGNELQKKRKRNFTVRAREGPLHFSFLFLFFLRNRLQLGGRKILTAFLLFPFLKLLISPWRKKTPSLSFPVPTYRKRFKHKYFSAYFFKRDVSQCRRKILEESLPKALSRVTAHVINAFSLFLFLFRQCHHIRECNVCTKKKYSRPVTTHATLGNWELDNVWLYVPPACSIICITWYRVIFLRLYEAFWAPAILLRRAAKLFSSWPHLGFPRNFQQSPKT